MGKQQLCIGCPKTHSAFRSVIESKTKIYPYSCYGKTWESVNRVTNIQSWIHL